MIGLIIEGFLLLGLKGAFSIALKLSTMATSLNAPELRAAKAP